MKTVLLTNFKLINGHKDMVVEEGWKILLKDGKIANMTKNDIKADKVIDLKGQYLMPGLIDLHIHLPASGKPGDSSKAGKLVKFIKKFYITRQIGILLCKANAKAELMSGTTTVRCVGGIGYLDTAVRDLINKGRFLGPRMLVANEALTVPGGHMEGTVSLGLKTPEEFKNQIDILKTQGVDLIKLMITGGVLDCKNKNEPGDLKMPYELVKVAVDYAHENGMSVAAHVEGREGIHIAIKAGVDTIEHGSIIDEKDLMAMKEKKLALVCTLSPALPLSKLSTDELGISETVQFSSRVLLDRMIKATKQCLDNDIPVGYGTDTGCPLIRHYDTYKEAVYVHNYLGLSNQVAIYGMTLNNAKIIKLDGVTGSIDIGKSADMLVLENNPLEDLNALKDVKMVFIRGHQIKKPKVKRNKEIDSLLSRI